MDIKGAVCCLLSVVDASMSGLSPPSSEEEAQDEGVRSPRLAAMQRDLAARLLSTKNKLLTKVSERLTKVLQAGISHFQSSVAQGGRGMRTDRRRQNRLPVAPHDSLDPNDLQVLSICHSIRRRSRKLRIACT